MNNYTHPKYEINELGQVRCKVSKYNNRKEDAIEGYYYLLPQQYKKSGYLYYSLNVDKKVKLTPTEFDIINILMH